MISSTTALTLRADFGNPSVLHLAQMTASSDWLVLIAAAAAVILVTNWRKRLPSISTISPSGSEGSVHMYRKGMPLRQALSGQWQEGRGSETLSDAEWQGRNVAFFAEGTCTLVGTGGNFRQFSWLEIAADTPSRRIRLHLTCLHSGTQSQMTIRFDETMREAAWIIQDSAGVSSDPSFWIWIGPKQIPE